LSFSKIQLNIIKHNYHVQLSLIAVDDIALENRRPIDDGDAENAGP